MSLFIQIKNMIDGYSALSNRERDVLFSDIMNLGNYGFDLVCSEIQLKMLIQNGYDIYGQRINCIEEFDENQPIVQLKEEEIDEVLNQLVYTYPSRGIWMTQSWHHGYKIFYRTDLICRNPKIDELKEELCSLLNEPDLCDISDLINVVDHDNLRPVKDLDELKFKSYYGEDIFMRVGENWISGIDWCDIQEEPIKITIKNDIISYDMNQGGTKPVMVDLKHYDGNGVWREHSHYDHSVQFFCTTTIDREIKMLTCRDSN